MSEHANSETESEIKIVRNCSDKVEGFHELTRPQFLRSTGDGHEYPLVKDLIIGLDTSRLYQEYLSLESKLSSSYLYDRRNNFPISLEEAEACLQEMRFTKEFYAVKALHETGSNVLVSDVGPYTRALFKSLGETCRMHYAVVKPGWESAFHTDSNDFKVHGFRINIPINQDAYYTFLDNERQVSFSLKRGSAWFINATCPHMGFNPTDEDRVAIICQLMTDAPLFCPAAHI